MDKNNEVFQAIADLREIRWAVDRARESSKAPQFGTLKTHLIIQLLAIAIFGVMAIVDLVSKPSLTDLLILTFNFELFRLVFIFFIFTTLITICVMVYLIVWRAARRASEAMGTFIGRNFNYLSMASFGSDLFIKFFAITAVILARRPDWVPAIMIACVGDYLIQGRGFVLPVRLGLVWGVLYLIFSVYVLIWLQGDIWQACVALVLPAIASAIHISKLQRRALKEDE